MACEHGVVYGLTFVVHAEGNQDYEDLLLMEHMPNLITSDLAPRIAIHTNLRMPENPPFRPPKGCLAENSEANMKAAKEETLVISLDWFDKKYPPDSNSHPLTGCSDHYSALNSLHKKIYKSDVHHLRSLKLVAQLSRKYNSLSVD